MKKIFNFIESHIKTLIFTLLASGIGITLFENVNFNFVFDFGDKVTNNQTSELEKEVIKSINEQQSNDTVMPTNEIKYKINVQNESSVKKTDTSKEKYYNVSDIETKEENLENNKTYTVKLMKKYDEKFYNLTLDVPSIVNFSFGISGITSYKFSVHNSDNDMLILKTEVSRKNISFQKGNLYLQEGTYTIKFTGGNYWLENAEGNDFNFTVKIFHDETGKTEIENNNTVQTANKIPINKNIKASTYKKGDVDYFTFTLDNRASICPEINFKPIDNYELKLYELTVADDTGIKLGTFNFTGNNKNSRKTKLLSLEAGTYIIRISRIEDEARIELGFHEYAFRILVN